MPRATRYLTDGFIYHLTHRCSNGEFFLKFRKERDTYREWLGIGAKRYNVSVLGYAITCNHTHIIADVQNRYSVANIDHKDIRIFRKKLEVTETCSPSTWVVKEDKLPYNVNSDQNNSF